VRAEAANLPAVNLEDAMRIALLVIDHEPPSPCIQPPPSWHVLDLERLKIQGRAMTVLKPGRGVQGQIRLGLKPRLFRPAALALVGVLLAAFWTLVLFVLLQIL
jgi:hypothetical protein